MRLAVCISHLHLIKLLKHLQREGRGEEDGTTRNEGVVSISILFLKQLLHFKLKEYLKKAWYTAH